MYICGVIKSPRAGIARNNMLVKRTKELLFLADESGKTPEQVADIIIDGFTGIVADTSDNWGYPIKDCVNQDLPVSVICKIAHRIGLATVKSCHIESMMDLQFIGHGDCPECGDDMEVTDGESRIISGDGYFTEYEYAPIWTEWTCPTCGHKERDERDFD